MTVKASASARITIGRTVFKADVTDPAKTLTGDQFPSVSAARQWVDAVRAASTQPIRRVIYTSRKGVL